MPIVELADRVAPAGYLLHQYKRRHQELAAPELYGGGSISQSYRAWRNSPRCAKTTFVSVDLSNLIRKVVFSRKFKGACKFSNNFMVSISSQSIILHRVPVRHVGVGGSLLKTNTAELGAAGPRDIRCGEPRPPASPSTCPVAKSRQPHPEVVMQPTARSECIRMLSFLASSDTCRSRAKQYVETLASIASLGHIYKPDSTYMKHALRALMMTDFMGEISRMRLENAICAATILHEEEKTMLEQLSATSHESNQGE